MEALTVTGAVFAGIGALLVAAGIVVARANRRFDRRALRAPGHVTGVRWTPVGTAADQTMTGFAELRFMLPDGREVETVARTGTTFDTMREGEPVTVLYDPEDPREARVAGRTAAAGSAAVGIGLIAIGGVCVLIGAGLIAAGIALEDALPAVIRS